ncbi:MAG TPA: VWA domain-containing protein, partial [Terriglobia bacterium]|nr:VWA domain-containing protein [Terriglobia bacterium]
MSRGLTFETYWPLLFLLVIPYIWWIRRKTWVDLSLKHLKVLGTVRSAIIALLAIGMMEPVIYRSGAWISVVYLLDVSQSVSPAGIQSAIQWIRRTNDSGKPDHARYIPFGENAAVFDSPDQLEAAGVAEDPGRDAIGQNATNIETAIDSALQNFAPHHLKRLVLITDGNENRGHATSMIQRLRAEGVRVYTMPLEARSNRDVWVESIVTPPGVASQEPFSLEVDVYSQISTAGQVELRHGEKNLGRREVQLVPGLNRVTFETSVTRIKDESGPIILEAEVSAPNDSFRGNNKFRQSVVVNGKPKVLYVEGHAQSAQYLQAALGREGFDVTTLGPDAVPASAAGLDSYDAVVLSDVARASLSGQQMQAMATYVREFGGGFILAGGETSYGEDGGYSKTEIERILPITFEAKKPHRSVAMIIVLDKSGSMGGPDFAFTKEAAKAPLQLLADSDRFGVVAFDSEFFWAVPFQDAENRAQMARSINGIVPGGETD